MIEPSPCPACGNPMSGSWVECGDHWHIRYVCICWDMVDYVSLFKVFR